MKMMPPQGYLRECFDYDAASGTVVWRTRPAEHFASAAACRTWNAKYAGRVTAACRSNGWYGVINLEGTPWLAHRLVWRWMTGEQPAMIDHKNTDKTDLRWCNLREATPKGNLGNMSIRKRGTKTGLKGVYTVYQSERFGARIIIDGKRVLLGSFVTKEEAHAAYCKAAQEHFGEFWNAGR